MPNHQQTLRLGAARRVAVTGLLGALALTLSLLEGMLPPVPTLPPGAKLGLSNIAVLCAVQSLGLLPALGIALVKAVFAGLTRGGIAFLMSLSGGLLSTVLVFILSRLKRPRFGLLGLGIAGALAHNFGQLLTATLLTSLAAAWYAPWLIGFGVLFGAVTGVVLRVTMPVLNRLLPSQTAQAERGAGGISPGGVNPPEGKKSGGNRKWD